MTATFRRAPRPSPGFTLIELVIAVAVVGILAAIAYPAYTNAVIKGKRSQGRAALLDMLTQQERYFSQNNSYLRFTETATSAVDASSTSVTPIPFKNYTGESGVSPAYKLGARVCTSGAADTALRNCVQVYATPQFTDSAVQELNVTSTGVKGCGSGNLSVCWN